MGSTQRLFKKQLLHPLGHPENYLFLLCIFVSVGSKWPEYMLFNFENKIAGSNRCCTYTHQVFMHKSFSSARIEIKCTVWTSILVETKIKYNSDGTRRGISPVFICPLTQHRRALCAKQGLNMTLETQQTVSLTASTKTVGNHNDGPKSTYLFWRSEPLCCPLQI